MIYKKLLYSILITCFFVSFNKIAVAEAPEVDIKNIVYDIENASNFINTIDRMNKNPAPSFNNFMPKKILSVIKQKFIDREWYAVVILSEQFVASANIYDQDDLLNIYYMRAYAEQKLQNSRSAISYYLKYLSVYITRPEAKAGNLSEVFRNIIAIGNQLSQGNVNDLKRLISSLAAIDLPLDDKTELTFLNALVLVKFSNEADAYSSQIALKWLADIASNNEQPYKKAKAYYYAAINLIKLNRLDEAEQSARKILNLKNLKNSQILDLAVLTLARIFGAKKSYEEASEFYQKINPDSDFYKDALYEHVYILKSMKKYFEASKVAETIAKTYPSDVITNRVKDDLSQIYMLSGQTDNAFSVIQERKSYWIDLQDWLHKQFKGKALNTDNMKVLHQKIASTGVLIFPSSLDMWGELIQRISQLKIYAKGSRDEARSLILNLGRVGYTTYMPDSVSRSLQLKENVKNLLEIGNRLVSSEAALYKERIPQSLKATLEDSYRRRNALFDQGNDFAFNRGNPKDFAETLELNNRLVALNAKLAGQSAYLRYYIFKSNADQDSTNGIEDDYIQSLMPRLKGIHNEVIRGLEIVRSRAILNLRNANPIRGVKRILLEGLTQLHGDYMQLYRVRDEYRHINEKYIAYEIEDLWRKFDDLAVLIFDVVHNSEDNFNEAILADVRDFERLDMDFSKIMDKLNTIEARLLKSLNESFDDHFYDLDRQIVDRISHQSKLIGDNDWFKYIGEGSKLESIRAQYDDQKSNVIRTGGYIEEGPQ